MLWSSDTTRPLPSSTAPSTPMVVLRLQSITSQFHLDSWVEYTIYYNLTFGPSAYTSVGDLRVVAVGIAFLAIYGIASVAAVMKRDI